MNKVVFENINLTPAWVLNSAYIYFGQLTQVYTVEIGATNIYSSRNVQSLTNIGIYSIGANCGNSLSKRMIELLG